MSFGSQRAIHNMAWGLGDAGTTLRFSENEFYRHGLSAEDDDLAQSVGRMAASAIQEVGCRDSHGEMANGGHMSGRLLILALQEHGALAEDFDHEAVAGTVRELARSIESGVSDQIVAMDQYVGFIPSEG